MTWARYIAAALCLFGGAYSFWILGGLMIASEAFMRGKVDLKAMRRLEISQGRHLLSGIFLLGLGAIVLAR